MINVPHVPVTIWLLTKELRLLNINFFTYEICDLKVENTTAVGSYPDQYIIQQMKINGYLK